MFDFDDIESLGELTTDAIDHELATREFKSFVRHTKPDYVFEWYHDHLCAELDKFVECWPGYSHLMIFLPPQHGKSELVSRRLPAYMLGRDPEQKLIATSYGDALAARMNRDVQRIIDSQEYREIFPSTQLEGTNVRTVADNKALRNSDMFEIVGHRGSYRSAGIGSGLTGMPGDVLIVDDPIKDQKEADSPTYRQTVFEWFGSVAESRLSKAGRVLILQTRWHEADLAGELLRLAKQDPNAQQYRVIDFPAIKEDNKNPHDPRKIGEALWPLKFPIDLLRKRKINLGSRRFNALYQQRPTAAEGSIIKRAWLLKRWAQLPDTFDRKIISVDASFKDTKKSDYVVLQVWGKIGARRLLIDQVRDRMDFVTLQSTFETLCRSHPDAYEKIIEDKANGPALLSVLKNKIPGLIAYDPKTSKDARLSAVSPEFEAGNVELPPDDVATWVGDFIEEMVSAAPANDDQRDACAQALLRLRESAEFTPQAETDKVETIAGGLHEGLKW
jgi:predicted phage terminase large subunit-like protein